MKKYTLQLTELEMTALEHALESDIKVLNDKGWYTEADITSDIADRLCWYRLNDGKKEFPEEQFNYEKHNKPRKGGQVN